MAKTKKGMSKEDIYKKLEPLKTDEGKYSYLKELSKKAGMLSPETRKAFYETLGDCASKLEKYNEAVKWYKKAGMKEKAEIYITRMDNIIKGDKLAKEGYYGLAAECYEKGGAEKKAKEMCIKEGDREAREGRYFSSAYENAIWWYKKGGMTEKEINIRIGDMELEEGFDDVAAEWYKKAGMNKKEINARIKNKKAEKEKCEHLYSGFYNQFATYLERGGEKEKAKKAYIEAGDMALKEGEPGWAIKYYKKALAIGTPTVKEMEKLADIYEKAGKGRKAMELRKKIAKKKGK